MKKNLLYIILLVSPVLVKGQFWQAVAVPVSKDFLLVQMDTTAAFNVPGWVHLTGDPSLNVKTGTGGIHNTLTVTTVSKAVQNWSPFGACTGVNTGNTTCTQPVGATGVMRECYFNANGSYNASFPQFQCGGFSPSKTYNIYLYSSLDSSFSLTTQTEFRITGATTPAVQTCTSLNNLTPSGPPLPAVNTLIQFSGVSPDGSGNFKIYFNPVSGQQVASLNAFRIVEQ